MKRRNFLQQTGVVAAAALVSPSLISMKKQPLKLVILHTNDTHSNIDPFPKNHAKFPDKGGVSRRAKLIQSIRDQHEHVLLLDAGDVFQGTPYFNKFKGVLEMKVMQEMGYDAMTMGNHDFDIGIEGFVHAKQHASFPIVNCNYNFEQTLLKGQVSTSIVLKKAGRKIGITGVGIDLNGLVANSQTKGLVYNDPISAVQREVNNLRRKGCDLVVCLSHLGFEYAESKVSDRVLAENTSGIDIIIGGHTHTFLEKGVILQNKEGKSVVINQVGYGGLQLGRIEVEFDSGDTRVAAVVPLEIQEIA
jgi:5'-nucleotidase